MTLLERCASFGFAAGVSGLNIFLAFVDLAALIYALYSFCMQTDTAHEQASRSGHIMAGMYAFDETVTPSGFDGGLISREVEPGGGRSR